MSPVITFLSDDGHAAESVGVVHEVNGAGATQRPGLAPGDTIAIRVL